MILKQIQFWNYLGQSFYPLEKSVTESFMLTKKVWELQIGLPSRDGWSYPNAMALQGVGSTRPPPTLRELLLPGPACFQLAPARPISRGQESPAAALRVHQHESNLPPPPLLPREGRESWRGAILCSSSPRRCPARTKARSWKRKARSWKRKVREYKPSLHTVAASANSAPRRKAALEGNPIVRDLRKQVEQGNANRCGRRSGLCVFASPFSLKLFSKFRRKTELLSASRARLLGLHLVPPHTYTSAPASLVFPLFPLLQRWTRGSRWLRAVIAHNATCTKLGAADGRGLCSKAARTHLRARLAIYRLFRVKCVAGRRWYNVGMFRGQCEATIGEAIWIF